MRIKVSSGQSLYSAVDQAISTAQYTGQDVEFIFNDVLLRVQPSSHEYDIAEIYRLKRKCGEYIK